MVRPLRSALAVLLLFTPTVFAAPIPAGGKSKDVSELPVAADSMAVVQLNGLDRTKGRLAKMLEAVDPAVAKDAVAKFDEQLKTLLENRDLKGIDPTGRIFLAVGAFGDLGNDTPPVAVAVPTPDYKTFKEKFLTAAERKSLVVNKEGWDEVELETDGGGTTYIVDLTGGYVILTPSKATAETYAGKPERLTAKKLGTVADSFLNADAALFLNLKRVNEVYGDTIKQGKQLIGVLMQQGGAGFDPKQMQAAKIVFDGLFQVAEDATGIVIGVEARPEGANLRLDAAFAPDTPSANALAAEKPTPLAALAALPKGMSSYTASKWGKAFADLQRQFGGEFTAPPGEDRLADAIEKFVEVIAAAGESVTVTGPESASLTATTVADPGKVADAKLKVMKQLVAGAGYSNLTLKANAAVKEGDQKAHGFTLHAAAIEVDYEASVKNVPNETAKEAAIEAMKKLVPAKQTVWFGGDGKRFVQVTAKDWAAAKKLLDGYAEGKAKAGDDPAFAATRKQLPDEAVFVALTETAGMLSGMAESFGAIGNAVPAPGLEIPKIGKPKGEPSYIGIAFTAQPQSARFDLFVPTAAMKTARQAIQDGEKEE
jgi:hypothetical protein